jgi:hypothetical protein
LFETVRNNVTIDWTLRENVRARLVPMSAVAPLGAQVAFDAFM